MLKQQLANTAMVQFYPQSSGLAPSYVVCFLTTTPSSNLSPPFLCVQNFSPAEQTAVRTGEHTERKIFSPSPWAENKVC